MKKSRTDEKMNDSKSLSQNIVECEIIAPVRILKKMVNSREVSTVVLLCVGFLFTLGYKSTQTQLEGYSSSIREKNSQGLRMALSTDNHSFEDKSQFPRIGSVSQELIDAHPPIPAVYMHLADLVDPVVDSSSIKRKKEKKEEPLTLGFRKKKEKKEIKKEIDKKNDSSKDLEGKETQQLPDLATFWHLPRTGGSTITKILGECFGLTLGLSNPEIPYLDETTLRALRHQNSKLVNVDLSTAGGIQRAAQLNIVHTTTSPSARIPLTDVIVTPNLYDTAKYLFNDSPSPNSETNKAGSPVQQRKGRLFTIFRHPVEREVSWFYHIKHLAENDKDSFHSDVHIYELSDWLVSARFLDNIMVRSIVDKMDRSYRVTTHDLHVAKEVIRRKCLILLIEEKAASLERLIQYFHWNRHQIGAGIAGRECEEKSLHWGWSNKNRHPIVHHDISSESHEAKDEKNDHWVLDQQSYQRVELVNMFDMQLYEYAKFLFWEQGNELF